MMISTILSSNEYMYYEVYICFQMWSFVPYAFLWYANSTLQTLLRQT